MCYYFRCVLKIKISIHLSKIDLVSILRISPTFYLNGQLIDCLSMIFEIISSYIYFCWSYSINISIILVIDMHVHKLNGKIFRTILKMLNFNNFFLSKSQYDFLNVFERFDITYCFHYYNVKNKRCLEISEWTDFSCKIRIQIADK